MLLSLRSRAAVSALFICVLSACGGGGDDVTPANVAATAQNDTNATLIPAPNQVVVLQPDGTRYASKAAPGVYPLTIGVAKVVDIKDMKVGYFVIEAGVMELAVGYLQDDKTKYSVQVAVPDSMEQYHCISAAWTEEEKAKMDKPLPPQCGPNIIFNPANNEVSMIRAPLYSASSPNSVLILNVQTFVPDADFSLPTDGDAPATADEAEASAT